MQMLLYQGMTFCVVGVVVGTAAAFGLSRLISTFLFGVQPWDLTVFVAVPLLLTLIALIAVIIPAIRATKIDPVTALRYE
jgi:ABC-type antimicrobial peptide transport system permease subunit